MDSANHFWSKCSSCKKEIGYSSRYYVCSVSSCNTKRTGYRFCSVSCFETHVPGARHKNAGAVEEQSPVKSQPSPQWSASPVQKSEAPKKPIVQQSAQETPRPSTGVKRRIVSGSQGNPRRVTTESDEILIIASRFKEFMKTQSDLNCSQAVMTALSNHVRMIAMQAADNARDQGRKTLMEYDFEFLKKINFNI